MQAEMASAVRAHQTHFIGQDSIQTSFVQRDQPIEPDVLILSQRQFLGQNERELDLLNTYTNTSITHYRVAS
jgi:hypothetical protein